MDDKQSYTIEVPAPIYPKVLAYMAGLMETDAPMPATTGEQIDVPGNGPWSRTDIADLHARMKNPVGRALISRIAEASIAEVEVTYEEVRAAGAAVATTDFTYDNLRSQLSWFAKYAKAIKGTKVWPMRFTDRGKDFPKGERYTYRMPPTIAMWWLEAEAI